MHRRSLSALVPAFLVTLIASANASVPAAGTPFAPAASIGPDAGSRIDATVTRTVGGSPVTLPAAAVPALAPGDVVDVRFTDYVRPPAEANYHANVAFVTETAPQHWLYPRSGPEDRLFANGRNPRAARPDGLRFVYGEGDHRGIPLFFIVPEDGKTRGMDGVRDYVDAHPTDFKNMSESSADAIARYSWFGDFLQSLGQGAMNPITARQRVEDIATSLGAPQASVDACYVAGGTQAEIANCIQTTLLSLQYQPNFDAPTAAQFFGGVAGAAAPAQVALYLQPLLTVWQIFARLGHQEYEYLPAALELTAPPPGAEFGRQLLVGAKVPTLRPPAARSSVLFFTIGDAHEAQAPPQVVADASGAGSCAQSDQVALPLHLDRTSQYVNAAKLEVTPDGGTPFAIPLDPQSLAAPVVPRAELDPGGVGETVRLTGRFGFDPLARQDVAYGRIAVPGSAAWALHVAPYHPPVTNGRLDVVAASTEAPCLSSAELQIGNAEPVPLEVKRLDDRRVELQASLQDVPPGDAVIRFHQNDPLRHRDIENTAALVIARAPARVAPGVSPVASLGDAFVGVQGSGLENVASVKIGGATFTKDARSTAGSACFTGRPLAAPSLEAGETLTAQFFGAHDAPGQPFTVTIGPPRPQLQTPLVEPQAASHLSTDTLRIVLRAAGGSLPAHPLVRIRRARTAATPCDAVRTFNTFALVPDAATHEIDGSQLALVVRAGDVLGDRAFGTLQVQLVDADAKSASAWTDLPGTFVRAPAVARIECPADPSAACTMLGTELDAVEGIESAQGAFVTPGLGCTTPEKGLACVYVPREKRYTLRLEDGGVLLTLSDALVIDAPAPAATK